MSNAVAVRHRESFIEGMREGKNLDDIIGELGLKVSRQAISKALIADPEYQEAKEEWHEARFNKAERMILDAPEAVDVARARAYWQSVSWRAEREFPSRWGAKNHLTITNTGDFAERLRKAQERVIEHSTEDGNRLGQPVSD